MGGFCGSMLDIFSLKKYLLLLKVSWLFILSSPPRTSSISNSSIVKFQTDSASEKKIVQSPLCLLYSFLPLPPQTRFSRILITTDPTSLSNTQAFLADPIEDLTFGPKIVAGFQPRKEPRTENQFAWDEPGHVQISSRRETVYSGC